MSELRHRARLDNTTIFCFISTSSQPLIAGKGGVGLSSRAIVALYCPSLCARRSRPPSWWSYLNRAGPFFPIIPPISRSSTTGVLGHALGTRWDTGLFVVAALH